MVTLNQAKSGIMRYLDSEVLPHMSGPRKYGAAVYVALLMQGIEQRAGELAKMPAVKLLGVVDDDLRIDLDKLYAAAIEQIRYADRLEFDIPVAGRFSFCQADIDRLYEEIKRS